MSFVKIILLKIFYSQALKHHSMICFHLFRFIFIFFFKILNLKQIFTHVCARSRSRSHSNLFVCLFVCFCGELVSAPLLNTLAISLFQCSCSAMAKKQTPPIDRPLVLSYRSQPEWQAGLKPPNLHACVVLTPMLLSPPPG